MKLREITSKASERRLSKPRTIVYGVDGIGKTTFAAGAESPIFVCTEDGATRLDVPQFPLVTNWQDFIACLQTLSDEEHDYQTLVIDSVDWAEKLCIQYCTQKDFDGEIQKFDAYGRGYKSLFNEFRVLLQWLDFLNKERNMEIILIAHAVVRTIQNPAGDDYDRYQASLTDTRSTSIWGLLKEWSDIVLFANYQMIVQKKDKNDTKGKGKSGKRVLHAVPAAAWDSKVRVGFELPDSFDLNYNEFSKFIYGDKK